MSIELPIPGLDGYVPGIQPGWILLVEGGPEPDKEFFLEVVAQAIATAGGTATWFTRDAGRLHDEVNVADVRGIDGGWQAIVPSTPTIVDSFSLLCIAMTANQVADGIRGMQAHARSSGSLVVLCIEDGMLAPAVLSTIRHMVDAIVQFRLREEGDTVQTFLRIPRWGLRHPSPQPIHYQFTGDRIALDTRRRHV